MESVPPPRPAAETDPPREPPYQQPPRPSLWIAPAAVIMGIGLGIVSSIVVEIIGAAAGSSLSHPSPAVTLSGDFVFDLSFVAAALYFGAYQGGFSPRDFGFRRTRLKRAIGIVIVAGLSYYVVTFIYGALLNLHGHDKLPSELGVNRHTAALVAAAVFVCVIAPIAEEFFFRGFLFGVLMNMRVTVAGREVGVYVAALITAILFGLAHTGSASPEFLVPLGFLGFVLCMIRLRTGSLYPCMALHSFNNCLALGVNQENWNALEIIGLMIAAFSVIAVLTGPLADRRRWPVI
jgi:membrane protease YdiL (CAAX protease family)